MFRAHNALDKGLPPRGGLNLVEKAVDRLGVFLLRVDGVISLGDQAEIVLTQVVEPGLAGDFSVKWPNDIYWKDYKIAGILIENTLQGNLILDSVVGVGLNVNQELFLSDAPNPMSLKNITGQDFDRNCLLEDIVKRFIGYMEMVSDADTASDVDVSSGLGKESVERLYHSRLYRREGWHRFRDAAGCFEARIEGVRTNGLLLLETRSGEQRAYEFKQVQFILPEKE